MAIQTTTGSRSEAMTPASALPVAPAAAVQPQWPAGAKFQKEDRVVPVTVPKGFATITGSRVQGGVICYELRYEATGSLSTWHEFQLQAAPAAATGGAA
jgi:hypothetical protein